MLAGSEKGEGISGLQTRYTHIIILYQDGQGAYDCLEWKEHIGGFLGDFYGHPGCVVCRLPARIPSSDSGAIAGCVTGIVECGADGEGDGGRRCSKRP